VLHLAIVLAVCALVAQVSGNNLSVCTGAVISSRIVSRGTGIWIAVVGYAFGLVAEGPVMRAAFAKLMPGATDMLVMIALGAGIVIFAIAHLTRVPQSLSQTFAAVILGIGAARHLAIDPAFVITMLAFWIGAPLASIVVIVFLMSLSRRLLGGRNVWSTARTIKASLLALSFFAAFTLGANTIGFVYAAVPYDPRTLAIVMLAIIVGATRLSAGELRRVGHEIMAMRYLNAIAAQFSSIALIEVATLLSVPLSNSVVFTSGVFGAGFSYKHRLLTARSAKTIAVAWVAMPVVGFLTGYVATAILARHGFG
jgi:inorganic phosphate transporter, PiT family